MRKEFKNKDGETIIIEKINGKWIKLEEKESELEKYIFRNMKSKNMFGFLKNIIELINEYKKDNDIQDDEIKNSLIEIFGNFGEKIFKAL
jgi:hypothetical protein